MAKKIGKEVTVGNFHLDANHEPFIKVADGGSNCANCLFITEKKTCSNKDFIKFMGSDKLPKDIENYCSDWYEPAPYPFKMEKGGILNWLNKKAI